MSELIRSLWRDILDGIRAVIQDIDEGLFL